VEPLEIEAVYDHGTFKLSGELPLTEGQKVRLTVRTIHTPAPRLYGLIPWQGSREEFDQWLNDPDEGQWGSRDIQ
jgi:predicted DNA-binding antitoxin AbrB/MazE fold protein